MKRFFLIFFVIGMIFTTCVFGFAADNSFAQVSYTNAEGFIFNPEGGDLFGNFKNIMPGDVKTQKIAVVNNASDRPVTIYMRIEVPEQYKDFLSHMEFTIKFNENKKEEKITLSQHRGDQSGAFVNDVKLGTFAPGQEGEFEVVLSFDKYTGNAYQNASGVVTWIFSVEEGAVITTKPTTEPTTNPSTPPTTEPPTQGPPLTTNPDPGTVTIPTTQEPRTRFPHTTATNPSSTLEPMTQNPNNPFTGSSQKVVPILLIALSTCGIATVLVLNKKSKEKDQKSSTNHKN